LRGMRVCILQYFLNVLLYIRFMVSMEQYEVEEGLMYDPGID